MYGASPDYERLQTREDAPPVGPWRTLWDRHGRRIIMVSSATAVVLMVAGVATLAVLVSAQTDSDDYSYEKDPTYWHNVAQAELEAALADRTKGVAKNVILFLGDGMGPTTVTAGRILAGQLQGKRGEETLLSFDMFPYTGLSRTYNTDRQVTDSAASGTAYLTGVKTNQGILGLNGQAVRANCSSERGAEVDSILRWSIQAGKSSGVVTTTRITHATPAASYSHCAERNWESDSQIPETEKACKDIAAQLVEDNHDINVILGGGRAAFYPTDFEDPYADNDAGTTWLRRTDNKDLISAWQTGHKDKGHNYQYVYDRTGLDRVKSGETDYLLGLFNQDHLQYEQQRNASKEPSLAEMTAAAIQILEKNKDGFFLLVEGGRIDHGHHASMPSLALYDVIAFADAVEMALKLTKSSETLIVVTADHSHALAFAGYPSRGNSILGLVDEAGVLNIGTQDHMPYTTLLYGNGPGYSVPRENLTEVDTTDALYVSQSAVPMGSETHGGEDVAIYATGPQSFLYTGVHEQNYIPMVMAYASCVGPYGEGESLVCVKDDPKQGNTVEPTIICDSGVTFSPSLMLVYLVLSLQLLTRLPMYLIY